MKLSAITLFVFSSLLIIGISCSESSSKSRKPVSSITVIPTKKSYVLGEKVSVNVKTKSKDGELQTVKLYFDKQLLKESNLEDFTVDNVDINMLGDGIFSVEAVKTDGLSNTRSANIEIVSDVIPEKYTYKVLKNYPHSKEDYTQGLEFYGNDLYEGTGDYGKSGLYKKQLESGKANKSIKLADKYFGEGITILNDKIYQLTYKTQIGFVYRLSDFACIDSFQYSSAEGWGLTNDGTNLIMSDGTNVLTWLNPNDFSIIKTLQVANNKGIINNLNELEYVDGMIYANIYTTDVIVKIDATTGKVLSEINLAGLLNMYKDNDRVDVLNGIAVKDNRFYVTGKLWPRLFEIQLVPLK